jgi:hypothetical protein
MGKTQVYKVSVGKPEGKRPLERPLHRREDGIRMDFREIDWGGGCIQLAQDRDWWWALVSTVMSLCSGTTEIVKVFAA